MFTTSFARSILGRRARRLHGRLRGAGAGGGAQCAALRRRSAADHRSQINSPVGGCRNWVNFLTTSSSLGIIGLFEGNHLQMAELFSFVKYD